MRCSGARILVAVLLALAGGAGGQAADPQPVSLPFEADRAARELDGLRAEVATLLLTGEAGGELEIVPLVLPVPGDDDGETPVVVLVEVSGPRLLQGVEGDTLRLELYAYALDGAGVVGHLARTVRLDLAEVGPRLAAGGVKFVGRMSVPPGEYPIKVLVRDPASGRFGLRNTGVRAPAAGSYLLPPMVAERGEDWLLVGEGWDGAGEGDGAAHLLGRLCGCLPSALPVLPAGPPVELDLVARRPPRGLAEPRFELLGLDGRSLGRVEAEVLSRQAIGAAGLERFRVRLSLPGVTAGTHALAPRLDSRAGLDLEGPPLLAFLDPEAGPAAPAWASLGREASAARRRAAAGEGAGDRPRGRAVRRTVEGYLAAVEMAVDRPWSEAVGALASHEAAVLEERGEAGYELMARAERWAAEALAQADPEALLPLVLLHADLHDRHVEDNRFLLSRHDHAAAVHLLDLYAETSGAEGARDLASVMAGHLGTVLLSLNLTRAGREVLQRALELDADNADALLQLAASHETLGDYPRAVELLRRLVEADPKSPEGRLRLAVNLGRTGGGSEAARILERLLRESNPDGILTVAYQELARLRLGAGSPEGACRVLADAVSRLPGRSSLWIAYAHALERAGRSRRSAEAARAATEARRPAGTTARFAYNRVEAGLAERRGLERAIRLRLPLLARALSTLGEGAPR